MKAIIMICLTPLLFLSQAGCNINNAEKPRSAAQQESQKNIQSPSVSENKELKDIKPAKPSRIKLHRSAKGEYAWDITGDNPDDVAKVDSRLRHLLKTDK